MQLFKTKKIIMTAALATSICLGGGALAANAADNLQVYNVAKGDTLWLLAQRYGTTVNEISRLNGLKTENIHPGQALSIPIKLEGEKINYTVQKGDTLFLIAERTKQDIENIRKINKLHSDSLTVGQKLLLPINSGHATHVVQPRESLWIIARDYHISLETLKALNGITSTEILVGQVLKLPSAAVLVPTTPLVPNAPLENGEVKLYRVQAGDTLSAIASRFGSTQTAIFKTNRLNSDILMPGQPLYIPKGKENVDVAGPVGSKSEKYGEFLPWEWARWVYNPRATATIIDWQTGKRFQVRHLGGSNHADSEPLTAADTAIMKSLYSQGWSWNTRPILLQVGDRILAASMAGMPHDVSTIANNNFNGHFDLYFYNSRSHNTNKIQASHQNNVLTAAGLTAAQAEKTISPVTANLP